MGHTERQSACTKGFGLWLGHRCCRREERRTASALPAGQGGLEVKILPLLATPSFVVVANYEWFSSKFHSPSQDLGRFWPSVSMSAVVLPPMGDPSHGHVVSIGVGLRAVGSCSSADVWAK